MFQKTFILLFVLICQLYADQALNEAISDFQKEDELFKQYASTVSGRKSLSETRYQFATTFLKSTKDINITTPEFTKALLYAESAMKLSPSSHKYALTYATFLSFMNDVEDAQLMAEVILKNIIADDEKNIDARVILTQVYINQFQFYKAGKTIEEIVTIEPVMMNIPSIIQSYIYSFSMVDEFEESSNFLHLFMLNNLSNYGVVIAQIELYKIQSKLSTVSLFVDIDKLKDKLQKFDEKFHEKFSKDIRFMIKNILDKEHA